MVACLYANDGCHQLVTIDSLIQYGDEDSLIICGQIL
jgi:hypothetical protein